jgi:hypothetical protein
VRGLLSDANVQGHAAYLREILRTLGLLDILDQLGIDLLAFNDLGLPPEIDDRSLWLRCQQDGLVLFTDNRNDESATSLETALLTMWKPGDLPVITVTNKDKFERQPSYRERVAADVAELLCGISEGEYRDRGRIFVPLAVPRSA